MTGPTRTGVPAVTELPGVQDVDRLATAAGEAAPALAETTPAERARLLVCVAEHLDAAADQLLPAAAAETHLPTGRLTAELTRTTDQLRMFAGEVTAGRLLDATIAPADPTGVPVPRPDLRRLLVPLGPVAVFTAGNFPFAFGVAGGDTASALAAGCPVVVKAHPGHPRLSRMTADIVTGALRAEGAPPGAFAVVVGLEAGVRLVRHPAVAAVAFTGSTSGGRVLFDVAAARPAPIPFYGELGSVNPVFVTREAVAARGPDLAVGFVDSYTLGAGQFCTKPGVLFLPAGHGLDEHLVRAVRAVAPARMLNDAVAAGYIAGADPFIGTPGVRRLVAGVTGPDGTTPDLYVASAGTVTAHAEALLTERFGPSALIVEYGDAGDLTALARLFDGTLTATIHAESPTDTAVADLLPVLIRRAGRLVWNGWPTGVTVSAAMTHGGPWPASTSASHTSVGAAAARRFLRPVTFQSFPDALLPPALRDTNPLRLPRRIDDQRHRDEP